MAKAKKKPGAKKGTRKKAPRKKAPKKKPEPKPEVFEPELVDETALAVQAPAEAPAVVWTDDRKELAKKLIIGGDATDDQFKTFLEVCQMKDLDPLQRHIYGIIRGGKLTIQTGIDGFRLIALRTREMDGQQGPFWCGPSGKWTDVWTDKKAPHAAKVIVFRKGIREGYVGIAHFAEYAAYEMRWDKTRKRKVPTDKLQDMWKKMPSGQLAKCAEALGLRKAFPAELSGLYTYDEMAQTGDARPPGRVTQEPQVEESQERRAIREMNTRVSDAYRSMRKEFGEDEDVRAGLKWSVILAEFYNAHGHAFEDESMADLEVMAALLAAKIRDLGLAKERGEHDGPSEREPGDDDEDAVPRVPSDFDETGPIP